MKPADEPRRVWAERRTEQHHHDGEAVRTRPHQLDVDPGDRVTAAHASGERRPIGARQDVALRRHQHAALRRDVDVLATAAAVPLGESDQRATCCVTGGVQECLRDRGSNGRTVGVAREHELTARREHRDVRCWPGCLWSAGSESADRDGDERWVGRAQRRQVDGNGTRFDHDVTALGEGEQLVMPAPTGEIDDHTALAAVPAPERQ